MSETDGRIDITPDTRLGSLLEAWPELEEVLLRMSPSFARLGNPVLRRTVARVATLRQVATVGDIPLGRLVSDLRRAAGLSDTYGPEPAGAATGERPHWVDALPVAQSWDAREAIDSGEQPMARVLRSLDALAAGDAFELVTPFVPAPIVDLARQRGFHTWSSLEAPGLARTWFARQVPELGQRPGD
jgi:hypothetical protein